MYWLGQLIFIAFKRGDSFNLIYEQKWVEDQPYEIGKIQALLFVHEGKEYYGFRFKQDSLYDYFDDEANSLRKAFLKSPLKFSRLTSGYTMRRFSPRSKALEGAFGNRLRCTYWTPILATGDGRIIAAKYSKFNGRFVKINHNSTYTTQYLHMSKSRRT